MSGVATALSLEHMKGKRTDSQPSQHLFILYAGLFEKQRRRGISLVSSPWRQLPFLNFSPGAPREKHQFCRWAGRGTRDVRKGELNIDRLHIQTLLISGAAQAPKRLRL